MGDQNIRAAEREHDERREAAKLANEAAIKTGESGIRALLLANGGAIVALLSFFGSIAASQKLSPDQLTATAEALFWFALGVAAGLFAMFFSYLTNLNHACFELSVVRTWVHPFWQDGEKTAWYGQVKTIFHWAAVVAAAGSLGFFVYGIYDIRRSIVYITGALPA